MTIQHSGDFGIERAGRMLYDISGKASRDPSGKQDVEIMMNHLGRSLREVGRGGAGLAMASTIPGLRVSKF
jgi:hypothetical protein